MMSKRLRILFISMMTVALGFGFLHLFIPGISFARLHIFLYNLVTGGTILLYYTQGKKRMTWKTSLFFLLALFYAIFAFLEIYLPSIILALVLALIVESVRLERFKFFPYEVFTKKTSVSEKFFQAALLCLSIGLVISSFAVWNETYGHVLKFEKLTLNTFFLGFSFPLSLISLSVAFEMMKKSESKVYEELNVINFWTITLGVVIFFVFILYESAVLELIISLILFTSVTSVLYTLNKLGIKAQQKIFLTSGISFLTVVAILGVTYIVFYFIPGSYDDAHSVVLHYHAMLALYGWNLSGLAVISRFDDFPIMLNEKRSVALHWVLIAGIAPLGYYYKAFAIAGIIGYAIFLYIIFFTEKDLNSAEIYSIAQKTAA